ncbi:hypothetical protein QCM80_45190 [Bradyrhizobium sp. SSUT112]|uniref:hypothetical protein n=1 Tax=Bradyrhizobium sp. SSUT112 TaxID=3040604 RepID=UPI00244CE555|nr:hypothetical protein [Bradyrhizobium sp. SSUT112]MDH2357667.1 hypothetical protein [Bradyrhizobium sp. SSUT112]
MTNTGHTETTHAQLDRIEKALACSFAAAAYEEITANDRNAAIADAARDFISAWEILKNVAEQS